MIGVDNASYGVKAVDDVKTILWKQIRRNACIGAISMVTAGAAERDSLCIQ